MRRVRNLIIGAGPAGLQLAYLLHQEHQDYLVLDRSDHAGSFFSHYPRHGRLLSINKRYTGHADLESRRRYDWNSLVCGDEELQFTQFSTEYFPRKEELVQYLSEFARRFALRIEYESEVTRVSAVGEGFEVILTGSAHIRCDRLFIATGVPLANTPQIPGIDLCEPYDRFSVRPEDYLDQRVFIVGKGNSAFETANALVATTRKVWICGPRTVRLAWASHYVGDLRAVNNDFLDTYQLKAQNNILDGELREVRRSSDGDELVASVWFESRQQTLDYRCDRVLLCTGFRADFGIFDETCTPRRRSGGRLPAMTCEWESVNVPNLFFIGTLMQARDYRKTMSAFIHGFRHNIIALVKILAVRDGRDGWPGQRRLSAKSGELTQLLLERLSTSAPLLLQPGFFGDVVLPGPDRLLDYHPDVPVDHVLERTLPSHVGPLYLATLEYGRHDDSIDPLAMPRGLGVKEDFYLHPIIRRYDGGVLVDRFWLPDDLDNDWRIDSAHREAMQRWLATDLG